VCRKQFEWQRRVFIYEGDFVISSLTLNPPSISPPGTVDVRVVVRNIGTSVGEADVALSVVVLAGGVSKATGSVSAVMGAGEERAFSIPISVDSSWQTSNYIVRVSVHSEGVVQAEAMKVLSVGPQGIGQAFSVPEITILLLPLLAAIALFLVYRKRKG